MNKNCPICQQPYTESQWRKTKAGGYRAFRHFSPWKITWCRGAFGQTYTRIITLATTYECGSIFTSADVGTLKKGEHKK